MKQERQLGAAIAVGMVYGAGGLAIVLGLQLSALLGDLRQENLFAEWKITLSRVQELSAQADATLRETQAVVEEAHASIGLLRESAEVQKGYVEATTRRSAAIAARYQLAAEHLDKLIVNANGTVTQLNASIEDIRKDSKRVIDAAEEAGAAATVAAESIGYLAANVNGVVDHLNEGSEVAIKQFIVTNLGAQALVAKAESVIEDPRIDGALDAAAAMPALITDTRTGVQEATKTVQCGRRGLWRVIRGCPNSENDKEKDSTR